MDEARFQDEMRRYWDEIARGGPASPGELDPELAATIRRLHAMKDVPPPNPTFARHLRENIMHASTAPIPLTIGPPLDGRSAPAIPRLWPPVVRLPQGRGRWAWAQAATAALLVATLLIAYFSIFRPDERPVVVPVAGTPVPTEVSPNDWPMYRGNAARTGAMAGPGPDGQPVELWRFQTEGPAYRSPAVVGEVVYAGSGDGFLYALDRESGAERWRYQTDSPVEITPSVIGDTVYVVSLNGTLVAVDRATGAERWRFAEAVAPDSTPVIVDNVLYVGSEDGNLYAIDPATGEEQWLVAVSGGITRSLAAADGVLYAGTEVGQLHALDIAGGAEHWAFVPENAGESRIGTPTIANGVVYANHAGITYALNAATGAEQWRASFETTSPIAAANGMIFAGSGEGDVVAVDAATGTERWRFATGDRIQAAPAVADDVVYIASFDRNVYALDAATGAERWLFTTDGDMDYGPSVANGVVYVSTNAGTIYAIGGSGTEQLAAPVVAEATPDAGADAGAATAVAGEAPVEFLWRTPGGPEPLAFVGVIALDPAGNLWVTDCGNNRFQIFAPDGTFLETWGEGGSGDGQFNFRRTNGESICGVAFAPDGGFYVVDSHNYRIQQFDADRNFVRTWGSFGTDDGQFLEPVGINPDAAGNVFVIDDERDDVQKFDSEGNFLLKFGGHGSGDGQLDFSGWGALDAAGNLWVADYNNHRIQQFAPDGTFLQAIGSVGTGEGQFNRPQAIAIDEAGRIYVTDGDNARVQVLAADGQFITQWAGADAGGDEFQVTVGIALDGEGNVYIHDYSDAEGFEAVQKFRLLPPFGPEVMATPGA